MNTIAQRRYDRTKMRVELVRDLERKTREVVETEQGLVRLRTEQDSLREQLLAAVGGRRQERRPLSEIPETILAAARIVDAAPNPVTRGDVAKALGVSPSTAGMRLLRALERSLVERVGHGRYRAVGRPAADKTTSAVL